MEVRCFGFFGATLCSTVMEDRSVESEFLFSRGGEWKYQKASFRSTHACMQVLHYKHYELVEHVCLGLRADFCGKLWRRSESYSRMGKDHEASKNGQIHTGCKQSLCKYNNSFIVDVYLVVLCLNFDYKGIKDPSQGIRRRSPKNRACPK